MKTWDDWSDSDVSDAILKIVSPRFGQIALSLKAKFDHENRIQQTGVLATKSFKVVKPDYCKSWADMGPIIANSKIDLTYEGGFKMEWESSHIKNLNEYEVDVVGSNYHVNPLRAAAIVFLMMNGVNPE